MITNVETRKSIVLLEAPILESKLQTTPFSGEDDSNYEPKICHNNLEEYRNYSWKPESQVLWLLSWGLRLTKDPPPARLVSSFLCDTTWEIAVKKCNPPKGSKTRTSKVGWFFGWPSLFGTLPTCMVLACSSCSCALSRCWFPTGPKSKLVWHDKRQATEKKQWDGNFQAGERVWDRVRRECGGNTGSTAMGFSGLDSL